jgi:hypothetical protein
VQPDGVEHRLIAGRGDLVSHRSCVFPRRQTRGVPGAAGGGGSSFSRRRLPRPP